MRQMSRNEGWVAFCLFGAFGISGLLAVFGLLPGWVSLVVWLIFVALCVWSQIKPANHTNKRSDEIKYK
jgi:hypothetical protein